MTDVTPYRRVTDPFELMRHEVDRLLTTFGTTFGSPSLLTSGRHIGSPLFGTGIGTIPGNTGQPVSYIPVDIQETPQAYKLIAEVPGLSERDININLSGDNTLTIQGTKTHESQLSSGQPGGQNQNNQNQQGGQSGQNWHVVERSFGQFRRTFTLPTDIDRDKIDAQFNNGLLTLTIPKNQGAQQQQRRIEVKSGGNQQSDTRQQNR